MERIEADPDGEVRARILNAYLDWAQKQPLSEDLMRLLLTWQMAP